ncbi:hypothetical protein QE177_08980 [Arsenophonus sp. aPb]|uniref:hypothetical protein n=1 Tax=Arsenophonus sp. aPb TaxID=3041619 RepID=UPI002468A741|nr:hypothetical protein [Arsenophonus sp. aPb]WGL97355.1 hypothetical protein QE177_08980 [Arsenophonus sp. aPb]
MVSKHHVQIISATKQHIAPLLPHVRQADIDEFYAMSMLSPREVLETGITQATQAWAGIIDHQVVTIFGVSPGSILNGIGVPWLVGSDLLEKYQKIFLRRCRPVLNAMLALYPELINYVDARNHVAKGWLHWLGFKLEEAKPTGVLNYPFHRFSMRAESCVTLSH